MTGYRVSVEVLIARASSTRCTLSSLFEPSLISIGINAFEAPHYVQQEEIFNDNSLADLVLDMIVMMKLHQ